jgi:3-methyladenine DNA glycosylase/8-oxoguanine DNA glycosylase
VSTGRLGEVAAPFHLEATVRVLQRRPGNLVDSWKHGRYRRVLETPQGLAWVEVENCGTIDAPDLRYRLRGADRLLRATRAGLVQTLRRMLGLHLEPQPLQRLAHTDRRLRPTALALRGMRPPRFPSLFEAFARVVPFQQLSLDAGVAIVGRLVERFGTCLEQDGARLHAFPAAQAIAEARLDRLRQCGLSTRKAEVLRALARTIGSGELSEEALSRMSTPDALQVLTALPGIGPWSASLVLLRGLGRLEVFPPGDVGAARGLRTLMHLRKGAALGPIIERFGRYRGYLYFYALGGSLLSRGLIHPAGTRRDLLASNPPCALLEQP